MYGRMGQVRCWRGIWVGWWGTAHSWAGGWWCITHRKCTPHRKNAPITIMYAVICVHLVPEGHWVCSWVGYTQFQFCWCGTTAARRLLLCIVPRPPFRSCPLMIPDSPVCTCDTRTWTDDNRQGKRLLFLPQALEVRGSLFVKARRDGCFGLCSYRWGT